MIFIITITITITITKMNFEDLADKTITIITDWIINIDNNKNYSYITIPCSYYKCENDIKILGLLIKNRLNLDKENNDIIESYFNDYFIFKYFKMYIIINIDRNEYNSNNDFIQYKIIKVFDRKDALIYRYGSGY